MLDEVSSSLDKSTELMVRDMIANLKGKVTIILVTHSEVMASVCDSRYELRSSGLVQKII